MNFNNHGCKVIKDSSLFCNILFLFFYSCCYPGIMCTSTKIHRSLQVNVMNYSTLLNKPS